MKRSNGIKNNSYLWQSVMAWFLNLVASLALGLAAGFLLFGLWRFILFVAFRYYDSGPAWVNTVSYLLIFGGAILAVVIGQIRFFRKCHKGSP